MLKKIKILLLIFISIFFLTGCEHELDAIEPLNEDEVISYAKEKIFDETGDDILVKIISKEQIKFHDALFWWSYQVKGGYTYKLEIINKYNSNFNTTAIYKDGYKFGDTIVKSEFTTDYDEKKEKILSELIKKTFDELLDNKFNKYYIYSDKKKKIHDIFLVSSDYNEINNLITRLDKTFRNKNNNSYYRIYIYKDENAFNNAKFKSYFGIEGFPDIEFIVQKITGKWPIIIDKSGIFDYQLFTLSQSNDYNYLIYTYDTFDGDEVIYDRFKVFGIK